MPQFSRDISPYVRVEVVTRYFGMGIGPKQNNSGLTKGSGQMGLGLVLGPGRPRWLGYGFFLGGFILGAILAFGIVEIADDFGAVIGIVGMLGAAYGMLEVYRGKPIWKR